MSITFSTGELLNIAIGNERRGIAFYDIMTRSADSDSARKTFQYLADMERDHIQVFQGMLDEVDKYKIPEGYAEEYSDYLQALVDTAIFSDELVSSELATQADSDIKALELAIGAEKDAILFYYMMKELMPQRGQATVDKIIAEEKSHLRQLSELRHKPAAA
ncbi:MAG: ferritin family protein [Dehalococcoidia bacterium]|nr:ferritin family protein [Dehalococcoidia bacterium]